MSRPFFKERGIYKGFGLFGPMKKDIAVYSFLLIALVLFDRVLKLIFMSNASYNSGGIFGIFSDSRLIFILFSLLFIVLLIFSFFRFPRERLGITLILAGLFPLLIDRIFFSGAIDFIHLPFIPLFNLGDVFIVLGVLILLVRSIT